MGNPATRPAVRYLSVSILAALLALVTFSSAFADWGQVDSITDEGDKMHRLYLLVSAMAIIVFVLVEGALVFFLMKYKRNSEELPPQIEGNNVLEVIWTTIPVVIVLILFVFSFIVLVDIEDEAPEDALTVDVQAFQFSWEFTYNKEDLGATSLSPEAGEISVLGTALERPTLRIPVDEPVEFVLHGNDVMHSFYIRDTLYKLDIIPGRVNTFTIHAHTLGEFEGQCAELCGLNHAEMFFNVIVMTRVDFDKWISEQEAEVPAAAAARNP